MTELRSTAIVVTEDAKNARQLRAAFDQVDQLTLAQAIRELKGDRQEPTAIVIDAGDLVEIETIPLQGTAPEIEAVVGQMRRAPNSLRALRAIADYSRHHWISRPPIIVFARDAGPGLVELVLRKGATWVLTRPKELKDCATLAVSLRRLRQRRDTLPQKPRVYLAENSVEECKRLDTYLKNDFDCYFAGISSLAPAQLADLKWEDAFEEFLQESQRRPFAAAVIDLALSSKHENEGHLTFADVSGVIQAFSPEPKRQAAANHDPRLAEVLSGCKLLASIRRHSQDIPLFIFSQFLRNGNVMSAIHVWIGLNEVTNVELVPKDEYLGYQELCYRLDKRIGVKRRG